MAKNLDGHVHEEVDELGVATILFYHPSHNAMPGNLLAVLAETIIRLGKRTDVRVIILKSGGDRTYCAGASLDELLAIKTATEGFDFFSGFARVINALRKCPKIVIGRVQGKAIGGGVGLAASSDYCFATTFASIKLSELSIGIGPFVVGPAIERKIGLPAFTHLALNPTALESASWGQEKGLYAKVFEDAETMDLMVKEMAQSLAKFNPEALTALKRSLWRGTEDWDTLLAERAKISGELVLSEFTKKALNAFKKGMR